MTETAVVLDAPADLVRLKIGKGSILVLTWTEYRRAITRGKREKRRAAMARRVPATGRASHEGCR